jgi:hypothetical protein
MKPRNIVFFILSVFVTQNVNASERVCKKRPGSKIRICKTVDSSTTEESKRKGILNFEKINLKIMDKELFHKFDADYLVVINDFSIKIAQLNNYISNNIGSRRKRKRLIKEISSTMGIGGFCSGTLVEKEMVEKIKEKCIEGYFDVCPQSFTNYLENSYEILDNLKSLFGSTHLDESECSKYYKQEI